MEIWKDIIGYEGLYEVSNEGRVRSADKFIAGKLNSKRFIKGRILIPLTNQRYPMVQLYKGTTRKTLTIHRLVAIAFIPNLNNYPFVMHMDNDTFNNSVYNLQWGTPKDNAEHMSICGRVRNQYM